MRFKAILSLAILTLLCFTACKTEPKSTNKEQTNIPKEKTINIVTTTGMIADAVKNVIGDNAEVTALMGAGVDPHLYKATQGDLSILQKADVVFYNGLHLEGKMQDILEKMGSRKPTFPVYKGVPQNKLITVSDAEEKKVFDPHIWLDVENWVEVTNYIAQQLSKLYPNKAETFSNNAFNYISNLKGLHVKIKAEMDSIPKTQRVLITSHDAFNYFGKAYNTQVKGLQGISTVTEFGLKDVANLVDFISKNKIKAIFVESSVPTKPMQALVEGCERKKHEVKIGGTLYGDAMGETGTLEGTYIGMMRHNVLTITQALK